MTKSRRLLELLEQVPAFPRFPSDVRTWTPEQIQRRFPVWDLWPDFWREEPPGPIEETWSVYGRGALAVWGPKWHVPVGAFAPGSLGERRAAALRVIEDRATVLPPTPLLNSLAQTWRARLIVADGEQPEVVVRNAWQERLAGIESARAEIDRLLPEVLREATRAGRELEPLQNLAADAFLHDDTIDQAIADLRPVASAASRASARIGEGAVMVGVVGSYVLRERLGRGGNGEVWRASGPEGEVAIKVLKANAPRDGVARFRREVGALKELSGQPGVLPLVDQPKSLDDEVRPWFAMPIATPLVDRIGRDASLQELCVAFSAIAGVLARVHARGMAHRDIKPDNLFWREGEWCVGDFGLVVLPDTEALTRSDRKLGPAHYIAPEMLNAATGSDGRPADIYSLAKTVWVVVTGQNFPLPGPHDPAHTASSIRSYEVGEEASLLDELLRKMTLLDPAQRASATEVERELRVLGTRPDAGSAPDIGVALDRLKAASAPYERRNAELERGRRLAEATFGRLIGVVQEYAQRVRITEAGLDPWDDIPEAWGLRKTIGAPVVERQWQAGFAMRAGPENHQWRIAMGAKAQLDSEGQIHLHVGVAFDRFTMGRRSTRIGDPGGWSRGGSASNGAPSSRALVDELISDFEQHLPRMLTKFAELVDQVGEQGA